MKRFTWEYLFATVIVFCMGFMVGVIVGEYKYYKKGQTDALRGIIKYEVKMDSTWVKK